MKNTVTTPLPGNQPESDPYSSHLLNLPIHLQHAPACDCFVWPNGDIDEMIEDLWIKFGSCNNIDDEFDRMFQRVVPSEPFNSISQVHKTTNTNVLKPITKMLTEYMGLPIRMSKNSLVSEFSPIRANITFVTTKTDRTIMSLNFKPPGSLLPAYNSYSRKTKTERSFLSWTIWLQEMVQIVCLQKSPYYILTDYTTWAFFKMITCHSNTGYRKRVMCWLNMCNFTNKSPSVSEIAGAMLYNYFTEKVDSKKFSHMINKVEKCIQEQKNEYGQDAKLNHHRINPQRIFNSDDDFCKHITIDHRYPNQETKAAFNKLFHEPSDTIPTGINLLDYLLDDFQPSTLEEYPPSGLVQPNTCSQCRVIRQDQPNHSMIVCFEKFYNYDMFLNNDPGLLDISNPQIGLESSLLASKAHNYLDREAWAYSILSDLQGTVIPYFYTIAVADPYHYHARRYTGILLEYLEDTMTLSEWLEYPELPPDILTKISERSPFHEDVKSGVRIKQETLITIMKENIIWALDQIHDRGVAHGNLTADNILIRNDSLNVVLVDFIHAQPDSYEIGGNEFENDMANLSKFLKFESESMAKTVYQHM